jgi:aconitase A
MGRPFVNVAFTRAEDKDTFNRIEPTRDQELFTKKFADILESFGYSPENAQQVALTLLPDILDYDYSSPEGYRNGRKLTDDIIDIQLALLTNGRVTTDKVEPHQDLLATFPYLGSPHPTS